MIRDKKLDILIVRSTVLFQKNWVYLNLGRKLQLSKYTSKELYHYPERMRGFPTKSKNKYLKGQ